MRQQLLLVATSLLATAGAAAAQTASPAAPAPARARAYYAYSPQDTIRAVRHLFGQRLQGGLGYVEGGTELLATAVVTAALRPADAPEGQRIDTNQDWLVGSVMTGYGAFRSQRFGPRRCAQIIAAYEQGEPLPRYVSRRLKTKYFRYLMP